MTAPARLSPPQDTAVAALQQLAALLGRLAARDFCECDGENGSGSPLHGTVDRYRREEGQ